MAEEEKRCEAFRKEYFPFLIKDLGQCNFGRRRGDPIALWQTGEFQVWVEFRGPRGDQSAFCRRIWPGWLQWWLCVSRVTVVTGQGCEEVPG